MRLMNRLGGAPLVKWLGGAIAALAAALDLAILLPFLTGALPPVFWLIGHVLLCGLGALALAAAVPPHCRAGWGILAFVLGLAAPACGLVAPAVAAAGSRFAGKGLVFGRYRARASWEEPEYRVLRPVTGVEDRIRLELSIQPLAEILRHGSPEQRRQALLALAHEADGAAAPVLATALDDPDPDVRFVAGMSLVQVEERCLQRLRAAQDRTGAAPADPAAHRELGAAYWHYHRSGLLDDGGRRHCLRLALDAYRAALALAPADGGILLELARLHAESGDPARSLDAAERHLAAAPDSLDGLLTKGQALFALRRLEALPAVGRRILELSGQRATTADRNALHELARFWIEREAA